MPETNAALRPSLRTTALNAQHRAHKAKMVDFGGWDMPVEYAGITAEHMAVRSAVGIFDVSHMGDIALRGPGSLAAINQLSMNDASKLAVGQAHYSAMLTPEGTFVDDIVVHRTGENDFLIVINAGTREKDVQWVRRTIGSMPSVHISDYSDYYTQIAIQGPRAIDVLSKLTPVDLSAIRNYWFTFGTVCGLPNTMIARTGYTGEDGFEIYIPSDEPTSTRVWNEILEAGREFGIQPCGLGARNTLRLESAMALYGHEISDSINVFEAGLGRYAKLDKPGFMGKPALEAIQAAGGPGRKLVGLEITGRGIARDGYKVTTPDGASELGVVTSGSPAPFLKKNIALAYVPATHSEPGTELAVSIRNTAVSATVVPIPFYKRPKKPAAASASV